MTKKSYVILIAIAALVVTGLVMFVLYARANFSIVSKEDKEFIENLKAQAWNEKIESLNKVEEVKPAEEPKK